MYFFWKQKNRDNISNSKKAKRGLGKKSKKCPSEIEYNQQLWKLRLTILALHFKTFEKKLEIEKSKLKK